MDKFENLLNLSNYQKIIRVCGTSFCTCGCGCHKSTAREFVKSKHYKSQFFKETFSDPSII